MHGTLDAELQVLRTIKRAELTAIGPTMVHVDNKGIIAWLWRGEMKGLGSRAKDADLWILICEELHRVHQEGILLVVEHVKAHRSTKEKQQMSLFERAARRVMRRQTSRGGSDAGWKRHGGDQRQHSSAGETVKNSHPSQKRSGLSWTRKLRQRSIARVVCGSKQISQRSQRV